MVTLFNIAYSTVVLVMFGAALYLTWNYLKEMAKDYNND